MRGRYRRAFSFAFLSLSFPPVLPSLPCLKAAFQTDSQTPNPRSVLTALNLPASLDALYSPPLGVPPSLLEKSQTLRAEGGAERLEVMMKDVRRVAGVGRRMWQEVCVSSSSSVSLPSPHHPR